MTGLLANIGESVGYTFRNTVCRPFFWIGMLIVALIMLVCIGVGASIIGEAAVTVSGTSPVVLGIVLIVIGILLAFFFNGLQVQIFANKTLTFKGFFGTIGRGIQLAIINLIYSIIILIFYGICTAVGIFGGSGLGFGNAIEALFAGSVPVLFPNGVTPLTLAMFIILILLTIFFGIFAIAADVNFARAGKFGAAFHFGEICRRIGVFGVLKFIVAIILFIILMAIISVVLALLLALVAMIPVPVAAGIIAAILVLLFFPFLLILPAKYFSNLFIN